MTTEALVIDCDGHILEPPDLWETYLEPRIATGRSASAWARTASSTWRSTAGAPRSPARASSAPSAGWASGSTRRGELRERAMRGEVAPRGSPWHPSLAGTDVPAGRGFGTMDMKERVQLLDREGMAKAVLYPTLGLLWEAELFDAELSSAYCRAYNRWIADFCRDSGGRLIPIAHLSLGDPAEAARELERAVKDGCRGAFVCPFTITRVPHGDPRHDAVFAAAQDLDVPLAVHPTFEPVAFNVHHRFDKFGWAVWYFNLFAGQGVQQAFATFFQFGVFERFPRLRVVVLESQAGWIGYFLDRADATFTGTPLGATVRLKEKPSYYFKRQCFISADPDERTIAALMPHVGEDKFFWASDYPHPDHPGAYLEELRGMVAPMTESGRRGILGENVARAYRIP